MHAHSFRSMFSRHNIVPCAFFLLLAVIVVCGLTAGTMQSSAEASGDNWRGNQIPPEFNNPNPEKEFNDDDLKVKGQRPRGKWGVVLETDMEQFHDASAPVAVGTMQSLSGGGKFTGVVKIKRIEIKNRSSKSLNSVQLRWEIVSLDNPAKVLLEGTTPFINFWAEANSSKVTEIPTLYPALLFKPLAKDGELNGRFQLTIGVQEARFADGSFWRRQPPMTGANTHHFDWSLANHFPSLASILPDIPPPAGLNNRQGTITPCQAEPRSSASALSFMLFQITSCHDDTTTWVDLETGQQSCGAPSPGQACYSDCNAEGFCNVLRVPGGRCSNSTPTPTPSPTPTPPPCEPKPALCCDGPIYETSPGTNIPTCKWDCSPAQCPTGTIFADGCFSTDSLSCPEGYNSTLSLTYGTACCTATPTPTPISETGAPCEVDCAATYGPRWFCYEGVCTERTPILVDVDGDGFALTDAAGGVDFALKPGGARRRFAWTVAGSDDAWLALDRDGNGTIDSDYELFGNFTPQPAPPPGQQRHGFRALAVYDKPGRGGNSNGVIDKRDTVFAYLRLWQDINHDGVSQLTELHTLPDLGLKSIDLDYKESKRTDHYGNWFRYRAKVKDVRDAQLGRWAWDIILVPGQ